MKPYTLTIRFRETDEYEAEVGAFMRDLSKHTDKSKNKFVIDLIAEYMKRSEQERRENNFIERLRKMIRERAVLLTANLMKYDVNSVLN